MKNNLERNRYYGFNDSEESILRELFIEHLTQVNCANSHLAERLPELFEQAEFEDLHVAIQDTVSEVNKQLVRINDLLKLVDITVNMEGCENIIMIMEDAFSLIHKRCDNAFYRDLAILYYLQNVLSVQESSFQMLDIIASKLDNLHVKLLMIENHQSAGQMLSLQQLLHERHGLHNDKATNGGHASGSSL